MIDGALRSEIPAATLFLLNPHGIVMGAHARLDVGGSFYMSTAHDLRFEDGVVFQARYESGSVLSTAAPRAFGFLDGPVEDIHIQGSHLTVPRGKTLGIIGGDMAIEAGRLRAPSGTLSLASVSQVMVRAEVSLSAAEMVVPEGMRLGDVTISDAARLETDGNGGGLVAIRSGQWTMAQSDISAENDGNVPRTGASIDIAATELPPPTRLAFVMAHRSAWIAALQDVVAM